MKSKLRQMRDEYLSVNFKADVVTHNWGVASPSLKLYQSKSSLKLPHELIVSVKPQDLKIVVLSFNYLHCNCYSLMVDVIVICSEYSSVYSYFYFHGYVFY